MFWAAIIGNELVGPFRDADGVKIIAKLYIDSIKETLGTLAQEEECGTSSSFSCAYPSIEGRPLAFQVLQSSS